MCNCSQNTSSVPNGINGYNAYTLTTAAFTQPLVNSNVVISVLNTGQYTGDWAVPGQLIFVEDGGYYEVVSSTAGTITMKYNSDYSDYNISLTAVGGTIASNSGVSPAGIKGINGSKVIFAYNDTTGIPNDTPIGASVPQSFTVPANTLVVAGDELEIEIMYDYINNDPCNVSYKLAGSTIFGYNVSSAFDITTIVNIKVAMINSSTQLWTAVVSNYDTTNGTGLGLVYQTSSNATTTVANLFEVVFTNTVSGANQLVLKKCVIKKHSL